MRLYLVVPGTLIALAGLIFTLQGLGIVGPAGSFMFQSTSWVENGLAFFILGLLMIVGGLWKGKPKATG